MSTDEALGLFKSFDPVKQQKVARFFDSEYKIFNVFDEDILKLQTRYGNDAVKINSVKFKTLYEPCISCKRQMIIRQEIYKFVLKVEAAAMNGKKYAKNNLDIQNLI